MSRNVEDLNSFVKTLKIGDSANVATSQYATNTTPADFSFDFYSTASAVRSLERQGIISAYYGWRYFKITRLK